MALPSVPFPCPRCDHPVHGEPRACPGCGESLLVCGHWRLAGLLGRGGMGTVGSGAEVFQGDGHPFPGQEPGWVLLVPRYPQELSCRLELELEVERGKGP